MNNSNNNELSISKNSTIPNNNNYEEYRCPKCALVPFIKISTNQNKLFMSTKCINDHIYENNFSVLQTICKSSSISNCVCDTCQNQNKEKIIKLTNNFFYCSNCYKFFCFKHGENHNLKEGHKIFLNKKIDSFCAEHDGTTVVGYCKKHNKNYCVRCSHFNENNKKIDEELNEDEIEIYESKNEKI